MELTKSANSVLKINGHNLHLLSFTGIYTCTELNSVLIFFFTTALLTEVFGALLMIFVVNTRLVAHGNFTVKLCHLKHALVWFLAI